MAGIVQKNSLLFDVLCKKQHDKENRSALTLETVQVINFNWI